MEPRKKTSSPDRSSPWNLGLLGILISSFAIIGYLRSKAKAPLGQPANRVSNPDNTKQETGKSEYNDPMGFNPTGSQNATTAHVCCHSKKERKPLYRRWKLYALLINILTLIAVGWYACLTQQQVKTSDQTFTETSRLLKKSLKNGTFS